MRSLQANGQYHVTKLGKAFFKDKFIEWSAHVPVIIRGRRRNGTPCERHDYLPVTALEMGLSRQNDAWSEAQIARNVKDSVLRQLGQPGPDEPIYMICGEVYFLHPTNEWAYSSSSMQVIDNRVDTQIRLRQLPALRRGPDPGQRLRGAAGHALRASTDGGALEAPAARGHGRFQLHLSRELAAAGCLPRRDPHLLCLAQRPHVLRGLSRPVTGLLPAS